MSPPSSIAPSVASSSALCLSRQIVQRASFHVSPSWSNAPCRVRPLQTFLLDEFCAPPPRSKSTKQRPSLSGRCTSFLLSKSAHQRFLCCPHESWWDRQSFRVDARRLSTPPSKWCAITQDKHPKYRTSHALHPSSRHDQVVQLTTHMRHTCLKLITWRRRWQHGPGSLRLACASSRAFGFPLFDGQLAFPPSVPAERIRRETSLPWPVLLRRFFALCSNFPKPSGT